MVNIEYLAPRSVTCTKNEMNAISGHKLGNFTTMPAKFGQKTLGNGEIKPISTSARTGNRTKNLVVEKNGTTKSDQIEK